jgi:hypothetical protein
MTIFNTFTFYHQRQETPYFQLYWRWKKHNGTLDLAIILFGHWFTIIIDHDLLFKNREAKRK